MNQMERVQVKFAQVSNNVLCDPALSLKAKGMFAYLYSKPETWNFSVHRMVNEHKDGKRALLSALQELEKAGYLKRKRQANHRVSYIISFDKEAPSMNAVLNGCGFEYNAKPQQCETATVSNTHQPSNTQGENNTEPTLATASVADSLKENQEPTNQPSPKKKNLEEEMPLTKFLEETRKSHRRDLQIIADWAEAYPPLCATRGQWSSFIKRHLRAAGNLVPFTEHQINLGFTKMQQADYITKPTLETVLKFIT